MDELKQNVAKNISALRTAAKISQAELAEKLGYSDKSVSKWERAESVPDIYVLKHLADIFGVSVDYIITSHVGEEKTELPQDSRLQNRKTVLAVTMFGILLLVTCIFGVAGMAFDIWAWPIFIAAVPVCLTVALVLNSLWFNRHNNLYILSGLLWSLLTTVFICTLVYAGLNHWFWFVVGIPAQLVIILSFKFKIKKSLPKE